MLALCTGSVYWLCVLALCTGCLHPACPSCPRYLSCLPCSALPGLHPACPSCPGYLSCWPCSALPGLHPACPACPGCQPCRGSTSKAAFTLRALPALPCQPPSRASTVSEAAAVAYLCHQRGCRRRVPLSSARLPPSLVPQSPGGMHEARQITPPTKNGHAPPPIESRKSYQSVNPHCVWTW